MENFFDVAQLQVDSHHGIYIPQILAQMFTYDSFEGLSKEDHAILLAGPDHEDYIEVWAHLDECEIYDQDFKKWAITQVEGDLYIYPADVEINWEGVYC